MAVTVTSGGMLALFDSVAGELPLTAAPTIALLVALAQRLMRVGAWAAVVLWVLVLPMAPGWSLLAPASMILLSVAFAVGPGRLLDWARDEWIGRDHDPRLDVGWIEDDRTAP